VNRWCIEVELGHSATIRGEGDGLDIIDLVKNVEGFVNVNVEMTRDSVALQFFMASIDCEF
jgi:hypothetical protein